MRSDGGNRSDWEQRLLQADTPVQRLGDGGGEERGLRVTGHPLHLACVHVLSIQK